MMVEPEELVQMTWTKLAFCAGCSSTNQKCLCLVTQVSTATVINVEVMPVILTGLDTFTKYYCMILLCGYYSQNYASIIYQGLRIVSLTVYSMPQDN